MAEENFAAKSHGLVYRDRTTGGANAEHTLVIDPKDALARVISWIGVKYSAAPTQTGVRVELDSSGGAQFDAVLFTGASNAQDTVWIPANEILLVSDDLLRIVAPAGGAGITASIVAISRDL